MANAAVYTSFRGHIYILGFGSIGQGVLPLLLRHIAVKPAQITVVCPEEAGIAVARDYGATFIKQALTPENYQEFWKGRLNKGDFLLNVSVDVSSAALLELCHTVGALYLDTCSEPWIGGYTDTSIPFGERSCYAMREQMLDVRRRYPGGPTAVITHGANPGHVSHFVKQALLNIAADEGTPQAAPTTREGWGKLAQRLGIKVVHIAESDTQVSNLPKKRGEFVNTWSVDGLVSEGLQAAELGWGTHEKHWPREGKHYDVGDKAAIYLNQVSASVRVRTWTPLEGAFHGFLVSHAEAISIADYFTVKDGDTVSYRPTCHYAYHLCDNAILSLDELAGKNWHMSMTKRIMMDDITAGMDELGVLLMGAKKGVYWYGSRLTIEQARALAPYNNATSLQVTSAVLAAMIWAIENPERGIVEPEEIDFARILEIAGPYLGDMVGVYSDWTPLQGRSLSVPEDVDDSDPWQFKNILVGW